MKSLFGLFVAALVGVASFNAAAQVGIPDDLFSTSATDARKGGAWGVTNYAIVPADGNGGQPLITSIFHRNDTAGASILFFSPGTNVVVQLTNASSGATNKLYVNSTNNGFADGDHLVIQHKSGNQPLLWEYNIVDSLSSYVVTLRSNTASAIAVGDVLWKVTQKGKIQVAGSTNSLASFPGNIFAGERNKPIVVEMPGTTTYGLDNVTGRYYRDVLGR